jgi:tRNA dimethylallyltransferase
LSGLLPVAVLAGPTGSGKSALALQLAARLPLEIISVDSAQVFRGLDIGTAKPTPAERAAVPHHLLDIREPHQSYSAGEFVRDARALIDAVHGRGRLPLLVGGTMLYFRALWRGIARLPSAAPALRAALEAEAATRGWPALHAELAAVDPAAALRIHHNDAQRIQRALEVFRLSGQPISELQRATSGLANAYRWHAWALLPADRTLHRALLAARLEQMLAAGFADEVRALYARGDLHAALPAVRSVGYRQLWKWCAGECSLAQARDQALVATCQLAKRQLTWLRSEPLLLPLGAGNAVSRQQIEATLLVAVAAQIA